ncbi:hypothetical protein HDU84_004338 [Entophlyctis sp. JEL0112]|nr:hypothetical protein HDU84_004338 [Entophlyctis sp. JEL0112]
MTPPKKDDDDWDTDPDFVNDISERDQRWGNQKTFEAAQTKVDAVVDMKDLRNQVVSSHNAQAMQSIGNSRRKEYQTPGVDQLTSVAIFIADDEALNNAASAEGGEQRRTAVDYVPVTGARPSSRVIHRPGGPSSDIFGTENRGDASTERTSGRRDPNWTAPVIEAERSPRPQQQQQQQQNLAPASPVHFADAVTGARPSSRVIHRPGGPSSNIFGSGGADNDDVPMKPVRRDPNWSTLDYVPPNSATAQTESNPSESVRDRNALSEPTVHKPSSRVLAPPGGKTSFTFG